MAQTENDMLLCSAEAKFLARQAAEQLLACQLRAPHPGGQESDAAEM